MHRLVNHQVEADTKIVQLFVPPNNPGLMIQQALQPGKSIHVKPIRPSRNINIHWHLQFNR